jgi:hypothetical protein
VAHGSGRRDAGASRLALGLFSAVVVTALLVLLEVALLPALAIGALSGLGAFFLYQRAGRKPAGNSRRSNARRSHETGTGYVAGPTARAGTEEQTVAEVSTEGRRRRRRLLTSRGKEVDCAPPQPYKGAGSFIVAVVWSSRWLPQRPTNGGRSSCSAAA